MLLIAMSCWRPPQEPTEGLSGMAWKSAPTPDMTCEDARPDWKLCTHPKPVFQGKPVLKGRYFYLNNQLVEGGFTFDEAGYTELFDTFNQHPPTKTLEGLTTWEIQGIKILASHGHKDLFFTYLEPVEAWEKTRLASSPPLDLTKGWHGALWGEPPPPAAKCANKEIDFKTCFILDFEAAEGRELLDVSYGYWKDQLYEISIMPNIEDKAFFMGKIMDRYGQGQKERFGHRMTWQAGAVTISTYIDSVLGFTYTWEPLKVQMPQR